MRDTSADRHEPARYEIRVQGHLDVPTGPPGSTG